MIDVWSGRHARRAPSRRGVDAGARAGIIRGLRPLRDAHTL